MDKLREKLIRGDANAWQGLYADISPGLYRFVLARVGNPETAQDIMQEGFTRFAQNLARIKDSNSYKTWLYSTCYRLTIDWHRARHAELPNNPWQRVDLHPPADPLTNILQQEEHNIVRKAVLSLSASHRDVVIMRIWGQLSYSEIAEITGLPPGTLRSQFHWAIRKLRQTLGLKSDAIKDVNLSG